MKLDAIYSGDASEDDGFKCVTVDGKSLDPCLSIRNHSPDGFSWGYNGSGPAQLALAIMVDFLGSQDTAEWVYQDFKDAVIARLPQGKSWKLTGQEIAQTLNTMEYSGLC